MKRFIAILLVFLYLVPAIGVSVNTHHCGGFLSAIHFVFLADKHKCGCGSKKMNKECCKDNLHQFKISDKHVVGGTAMQEIKFQHLTILPYNTDALAPANYPVLFVPFYSHAPPVYPPGSLFDKHCSFLI